MYAPFILVGRPRHFPARAESEGAGLHRHLLQVQGAAGGDYQVRLPECGQRSTEMGYEVEPRLRESRTRVHAT